MSNDFQNASRRRFLRNSLAALAGGAGFFGAPQSLSLINSAWAQQRGAECGGDYKALVCVFLLGGNDGHNLVVPRGNVEYGHYAQRRRGLSIPQAQLLPLQAQGAPFALGLHPAMTRMANLFNTGKMAVIGNVGALLQPVSRQQYDDRTARLPPQLFSHNDQQAFWQSLQVRSPTDITPATGWAGRLAELIQDSHNPCGRLTMNLSLAGANPFQAGSASEALSVDSGPIRAVESDREPGAVAELEAVYALGQGNPLVEEYRRATRSAIDNYAVLREVLAAAPALPTVFPPAPEAGDPPSARFAYALGSQLRRAAELISVRAALGQRRQIFFCSLGGFDTHDAQSADQPELLSGLDQALAAFHQATRDLNVENAVTTFAASEFGRSLTSNGDGSDHGWGNHLFALGGAVNGGRVYGAIPDLSPGSTDFAGDGNLIPKLSVDQYGATLARWFGVSDAALLDLCFPNLANFSVRDLGFLA
ncbi:DUF1501 domain-containing protein [Tahibacter harae]|uniref:DUF1501 domain-containing protein n=1 Tax=Tahibacter harae TaxID=2963937 RepID=A0ABT1QUK9_9GAMM|nr:DUF1501 domain-containing protein [Tahibacter harae]MCQ4165983.1 DUF1501 domain-containing protein [Tahibacter harae]